MICLGIESTAHTFGAGIIKGKCILANSKSSFQTKSKGMIPSKVADHHVEVCDSVINDALKQAKISINDIDLISLSRSPGISCASALRSW